MKKKILIWSSFITLVIAVFIFYFFLPPINLKSINFYLFLLVIIVFYSLIKNIFNFIYRENFTIKNESKIFIFLIGVVLLAGIFGLKIWHAKKYSLILQAKQGNASEIPSVNGTSSIALMDTASAEKLGDRKIGSLTDVVSQFKVGKYSQIDYKSSPIKVAALQYESFFKWLGNHHIGIPGYVKVNPVSMSADYVNLNKKMIYTPSSYFNENLIRKIRFTYPTVLFDNIHFEIDEDGNPWYIASVYNNTISLFGGKKIVGAILVNPINGQMQKLSLKNIPRWVDIIFEGDLIVKQYNDSVQLHRGFWNSLFGQVDCRKTTTVAVKKEDDKKEKKYQSDYGYVAKDGDIWIFTGVTSVNGDSSNIGFILANERTGETKFILASGADEASAMHSAEGEVQEKRYSASFPSLINIDGIPTYIMVLKDNSGLVKMYACVNVEQYNLVVTANTQKDVIEQYHRLMKGEISADEANKHGSTVDTSKYIDKTIQIVKLEKININGNTYLYIMDKENKIYKAKYIDVLKMLNVKEGDSITIKTDGTNYLYK